MFLIRYTTMALHVCSGMSLSRKGAWQPISQSDSWNLYFNTMQYIYELIKHPRNSNNATTMFFIIESHLFQKKITWSQFQVVVLVVYDFLVHGIKLFIVEKSHACDTSSWWVALMLCLEMLHWPKVICLW